MQVDIHICKHNNIPNINHTDEPYCIKLAITFSKIWLQYIVVLLVHLFSSQVRPWPKLVTNKTVLCLWLFITCTTK